jgi:tetratricopeptide (TPR) repeat protein
MAAAKAAASAADRSRILREAVAISHDSSQARLDLFRAAHDAGQFQLAVAAFEPLAANTNLAYRFQQYDSPLDEQQPDVGADRWLAQQFLAGHGQSDQTRAAIAGDLAHALEQTGRLSSAELLYRLAIELTPAGPQRSAAQQNLERVRAARQLRAENARRRPVVTKNLGQEHLVRPRLAALPGTGGAP